MFNGIIYNTGLIAKISKKNNSSEIVLKTDLFFRSSEVGSSLCCNGTCLTVTKIQKKFIYFYISKETLNKTNFRYTKIDNLINIEKSLNYGTKVSGHYVQGHIDTTGYVSDINVVDKNIVKGLFSAGSNEEENDVFDEQLRSIRDVILLSGAGLFE